MDNKLNFYEFLPENPASRPVFADSLEIGKKYGTIVTTPAGMYRYKTDTVIKIESIEDDDIVFSVM